MKTLLLNNQKDLFLQSDNDSIYHSLNWMNILENGFNVDIKYLCTYELDSLLCCTPITIKKFFGILCIGSPLRGLFTEYLGPKFKNNISNDLKKIIINDQLNFLKKLNPIYIEYCLNNDFSLSYNDINTLFNNFKFKYYERTSIVINLSFNIEEIWLKFTSRARNMIRKAERSNLSIHFHNEISDNLIFDYYQLLTKSFKKRSINPPHSYNAYKELFSNLEINKSLIFVSAFFNNKIISASVFIIDRSRIIYHSSGSNELGFKLAAPSLIQWEIIKFAKNRDLLLYDLGGTGVKSIDKFKVSFGGISVVHHRWVYTTKFVSYFVKIIKYLTERKIIKIY